MNSNTHRLLPWFIPRRALKISDKQLDGFIANINYVTTFTAQQETAFAARKSYNCMWKSMSPRKIVFIDKLTKTDQKKFSQLY